MKTHPLCHPPTHPPNTPVQVESDIAPYKGLLMGLFFMTGAHPRQPAAVVLTLRSQQAAVQGFVVLSSRQAVRSRACCGWPTCSWARTPPLHPAVGMEISVPLFFAKIKTIVAAMAMLIVGKVAVMAAVGQAFGLTLVQSARRWVRRPARLVVAGRLGQLPTSACASDGLPPTATCLRLSLTCGPSFALACSGLLLSPGGEFAFVLFGEAVSRGIMGAALAKELYLVVALRCVRVGVYGWGVGEVLEGVDSGWSAVLSGVSLRLGSLRMGAVHIPLRGAAMVLAPKHTLAPASAPPPRSQHGAHALPGPVWWQAGADAGEERHEGAAGGQRHRSGGPRAGPPAQLAALRVS